MANENIPIEVPVTLYAGSAQTSQGVIANWGKGLTQGMATILYQNATFGFPLGLYVNLGPQSVGTPWRLAVPLQYISEYVIDGGKLSVYMNLTQAVSVDSNALVFFNGGGPQTGVTSIGPGMGVWGIVDISAGGLNPGPQQASFVYAGPVNGGAAVPTFRALQESDTPYAAPLVSPAFTGSPTSLNPQWPAPYDGGSNYTPGQASNLATRDLVKAAIAGALGNFATIVQVDSTTGTLPQTGQGTLWAMNYAVANGLPINLPSLSSYVAPLGQWNGTTFSFVNVGQYPGYLDVAPSTADYILWGNNQLNQVIVNPGETVQISYYYWNGQQQWIASGGTCLAQANDTYVAIMEDHQTTAVPITAMGKKQIYLTGTLTAISRLSLPNYGEWVLVNGTIGAQTIYVSNQAYPSGQTIILLPGCNVHVTTGDYGTLKGQMAGVDIAIQTSNSAINGNSYQLIAPATPNPLVLNSQGNAVLYLTGPMLLYHSLEIIDDTQGGMTDPIVYTFNPDFYTFQGGQWTFFNNLQQTSPKNVYVGDLQGTQIQVPVGQAVTVFYTSSGKIYKV